MQLNVIMLHCIISVPKLSSEFQEMPLCNEITGIVLISGARRVCIRDEWIAASQLLCAGTSWCHLYVSKHSTWSARECGLEGERLCDTSQESGTRQNCLFEYFPVTVCTYFNRSGLLLFLLGDYFFQISSHAVTAISYFFQPQNLICKYKDSERSGQWPYSDAICIKAVHLYSYWALKAWRTVKNIFSDYREWLRCMKMLGILSSIVATGLCVVYHVSISMFVIGKCGSSLTLH